MTTMTIPGLAVLGRPAADAALRVAATALLGAADGWKRSKGARLVDEVSTALGAPDDSVSYLLLACLERRIPTSSEILDFTRDWRLQGLRKPLRASWSRAAATPVPAQAGEVVVDSGIVIDVTDTGRSRFTTGIQRVSRATITRWARDHDVSLVSWTLNGARLVGSSDDEISRVILDDAVRDRIVQHRDAFVVPFRATFVLPEITTESKRTWNIHTIARFSRSRSTAIGFDCIPVTTSETSGPGMPGAFSKYLAALSAFDAVGAISSAAATEYGGWRRMLGGTGLEGPRVETIALPWQTGDVADDVVESTRRELGLDDGLPIVLAVGSHEPRKNHLNLLAAAELNWRRGHDFHLVLVGGNAWGDGEFKTMVANLRRVGRRISLLSGVSDEIVWSLYRLARFSVFCSINEGFGLPVVESLASGTPVLTSDFGSMRDLGEDNGAVLVSPHDIAAMAMSIGALLTDDALVSRLAQQADSLEHPSWDDYADAMWSLATE
ncbi:hypothetical protein GCM10025867_37520 [Frondihabitans sucicola]|uniref:Glycosyl transferase family 1 domain-containing protein n=1 Tax=Frondihabitans sucicola TaxID=1268041 RepID=A0ABM8GSR2_9MICO|nr:glycosyltransferase family 1 protein [Frondihabitans sucicola]BDZ51511.1 hypothetical protein GCM10025867_37520 [Frondihabitans sucicola]